MTMSLNDRNTYTKVVGASMGGATFIANFKGAVQVWVEARREKGVLVALKKPRIIMQSEMAPLVAHGYLREQIDGTKLTIALTDKRP